MSHSGKVKCKGCPKHCWVGWTETTVIAGQYVKNSCLDKMEANHDHS
jgi:hypothetical protein